ncbi:MAG: hypothetical protein GY847_01655 [Proteobacteria bacterium]|nr:hypothetical protein [Pseudomonadota bacterium]
MKIKKVRTATLADMTIEDAEHLDDLIEELTQDIKDWEEKTWLHPALISHLSRLTNLGGYSIKKIIDQKKRS